MRPIRVTAAVVAVCAAAAPAPLRAGDEDAAPAPPAHSEAQEAAWRNVWETTYDERIAADPRRHHARGDVLVLPFPAVVDPGRDWPKWFPDHAPAPRRVARDEPLLPSRGGTRLAMRVLPMTPLREEYLARRDEVRDPQAFRELVRWCTREKLHACLAFEARQMLGGTPGGSAYRKYLGLWKAHAETARTPYALDLPVSGEWFVMPASHHRRNLWSYFAVDLVQMRGGRTSRGASGDNRDYHAWGEPVVAQAEGVVVQAVDGTPDNPPGRILSSRANMVQVDYGGLRATYAHFQHGSVEVEVGQRVARGDVLGRVGNSGTSTAPHLHYAIEDEGGAALKARFTIETRGPRARKWRRVDGGELREGSLVRNLPLYERAGPRKR